MSTKVTLNQLISARSSARVRLSSLRYARQNRFKGSPREQTPLEVVGCFESELNKMEKALKSIESRINNATITIPD